MVFASGAAQDFGGARPYRWWPGPLARQDPGAHTKSLWTRSVSDPAGNPRAGGTTGGPGTAGPDSGPGWSLRRPPP